MMTLIQAVTPRLTPMVKPTPRFKSTTVEPAAVGTSGHWVAPMVLEGAPPFEPNKPESLDYYMKLMEHAKTFSVPQVSGRQIGVVAIGESGRVYLGTNIEIKGSAPSDVVHGEVFAVTLAKAYGEKGLKHMILSAPGCGSCRQVMREGGSEDTQVYFKAFDGKQAYQLSLGQMLPHPFSYATATMNMYTPPNLELMKGYRRYAQPNTLTHRASDLAEASYLNKAGKRWAGLAITLKPPYNTHGILGGNVTTISGPNPTISPMQEVMIKLAAQKIPFTAIDKATMAEPSDAEYSFIPQARLLLGLIAPQTKLRVAPLQPITPVTQ